MTKYVGQEDMPGRFFSVESRLGMAHSTLNAIARNIGRRGRGAKATPEEQERIAVLKAQIKEMRGML